MAKMHRPRFMSAVRLFGVLLLLAAAALTGVATSASPAHAANDLGYRGPSYGSSVSAPTAEKPQSKLWYAAGSWWGALWAPAAAAFTIHRLDWATQTWSSTGVVIDTRTSAKIDALWDGGRLYIASAGQNPATASHRAQVRRYSWVGGSWVADSGYPVTLVSGGMDSVVIDRDAGGTLWATWVRDGKVYVTHSASTDTQWVTPYVLPVPGADDLRTGSDGDDATLVAFGDKVGILWGNEGLASPWRNSYYFAVHVNGTDDSAASWSRELAYGGDPNVENADDHLNIKSLQTDSEGRLFAVVKTSLNASSDPLNVVLVRSPSGVWDRDNVFGRASDSHTRAILALDDQNDQVHVFAAAPCCSGGTIYHKKASFQALANGNPFANGLGAPFIQSTTDPKINNPTTTKQTLNGTTGLVVLAGDDSTRRYLHNSLELGNPNQSVPDTAITAGPSGEVGSTSATFSFTSTNTAATFECSLDGAAFTACTSPRTYSGLPPGAHHFEVRAVTAAGPDPTPAVRDWTVVDGLPTMLAPVADASVQSRSPATPFGGAVDLLADTSPAEESYLRFTVARADPVSRATLRLWATNGSGNGPGLYRAASAGWSESSVTWNTKPGATGGKIADVASAPAGTWVEYDVTATVTGPGTYDWALIPDSSDGMVVNAREASSNKPQLVLDYTIDSTAPTITAWSPLENAMGVSIDTTVTATFSENMDAASLDAAFTLSGPGGPVPAALTYDAQAHRATLTPAAPLGSQTTYTATVSTGARDVAGNALESAKTWSFTTETVDPNGARTFLASADALVEGSRPAVNSGSLNQLRADTSPQEHAYLRFDVGGLAGIVQSAVLRLHVTNGTSNAPRVHTSAAGWDENAITWGNRPTPSPSSIADAGSVAVGQWLEYDVTTAVAGNGPVSFALLPESSDGMFTDSREVAAGAPELVVTTAAPDNTPPDTTLTAGPTGTVAVSSATFEFTASEAGSTFECKLDAATYTPCTSPTTYTALPDGAHTFMVRAIDGVGNIDPTPASRSWTVAAPLQTVIESGPADPSSSTSATLAFTSNRSGASFECRLDGGAWAACTSPHTYTLLLPGPHEVQVRAVSGADVDTTPATWAWNIDPAATQTVVVPAAGDAYVQQSRPTANTGVAGLLRSDSSPLEETYIWFDLPATGAVQSATLRLYAENGTGNAPAVHQTPATWAETGITWNNRPAAQPTELDNKGSAPAGAWVEYDVTGAVTQAGPVSFALIPESSDGMFATSREGDSNTPELVVSYAS